RRRTPTLRPRGRAVPTFGRSVDPALEGKVVTDGDITPLPVEQYRRLAGALHDLQTERGLKTLIVSSAAPREGKTLTVINLALTLSDSYKKRVLLIDADLRRASIHGIFGLPQAPGLVDYLRSPASELPISEVRSEEH